MRDVGFITVATNLAEPNSNTERHLVISRITDVSVTAANTNTTKYKLRFMGIIKNTHNRLMIDNNYGCRINVRPILEFNTTVWSPVRLQKKTSKPSRKYIVGLRRDCLD